MGTQRAHPQRAHPAESWLFFLRSPFFGLTLLVFFFLFFFFSEGYIVDTACVNNIKAFDTQISVLAEPEKHTLYCLTMQVCLNSGFVSVAGYLFVKKLLRTIFLVAQTKMFFKLIPSLR